MTLKVRICSGKCLQFQLFDRFQHPYAIAETNDQDADIHKQWNHNSYFCTNINLIDAISGTIDSVDICFWFHPVKQTANSSSSISVNGVVNSSRVNVRMPLRFRNENVSLYFVVIMKIMLEQLYRNVHQIRNICKDQNYCQYIKNDVSEFSSCSAVSISIHINVSELVVINFCWDPTQIAMTQ